MNKRKAINNGDRWPWKTMAFSSACLAVECDGCFAWHDDATRDVVHSEEKFSPLDSPSLIGARLLIPPKYRQNRATGRLIQWVQFPAHQQKRFS